MTEPRFAPTEPWMDPKLSEALSKPYLDHPSVAYHAALSLLPEQVFALRFIPNQAGHTSPDNTNLLEFARYASFLSTLKSDAGMTAPSLPPMVSAVEIVVRIGYAFIGSELTVERIINQMSHEEIGIMNITHSDRLAWNYATRAVAALPEELLNIPTMEVLASEGFRVVFRHAQAFVAEGPLSQERQRDLAEIAAQVLIGIGLDSVPAYQKGGIYAKDERDIAAETRRVLRLMSESSGGMAEELGVDIDRALALHDPDQLGN